MKLSAKLTTGTLSVLTIAGLAAPTASAASFNEGLYPRPMDFCLDPTTVQILDASPAKDIAQAGETSTCIG